MRPNTGAGQVPRTTVIAALVVVFAGTGCEPTADSPDASVRDDYAGALNGPGVDTLPAADTVRTAEVIPRAETILIEGTPEQIPVQAANPPATHPLPFSTIAPADMVINFAASEAGDEVRFVANFGGVLSPEAMMSFVVLPAGLDREDAQRRLAALASELGGVREPRPGLSWADEVHALRGEFSGFLAPGERNGRWFYFLARYPPEYGDGMAPRIELILRRWIWSDGDRLLPDQP